MPRAPSLRVHAMPGGNLSRLSQLGLQRRVSTTGMVQMHGIGPGAGNIYVIAPLPRRTFGRIDGQTPANIALPGVSGILRLLFLRDEKIAHGFRQHGNGLPIGKPGLHGIDKSLQRLAVRVQAAATAFLEQAITIQIGLHGGYGKRHVVSYGLFVSLDAQAILFELGLLRVKGILKRLVFRLQIPQRRLKLIHAVFHARAKVSLPFKAIFAQVRAGLVQRGLDLFPRGGGGVGIQ